MMDDECQSIPIQEKFRDPQNSKTRCLVILLNAAAICGLLNGMLPEGSALSLYIEIFMPVFLACMLLVWCIIDAEENKVPVSFGVLLLLILVYPIGFPYYLCKIRKNGPVLMTLLLAFLFLLLCSIFYTITYAVGNFIYGWIYH